MFDIYGDTLKHYPQIEKEKISRPLFIIGMPRTGTTFLHRLISMDNRNRSPLLWETRAPAPPPYSFTVDNDSRIIRANNYVKKLNEKNKKLQAIHYLNAKAPEECMWLLANNFRSTLFRLFAKIPQYMSWLYRQDMIPTYLYHRQQIKILQFRYPTDCWLLKAPEHMFALNALLSVYPDACIVHTHRSITESIPSLVSLLDVLRKPYTDDKQYSEKLGQETVDTIKIWTDMCLEARKNKNSDRFFDISYKELIQDPIVIPGKVNQKICGYCMPHINFWLVIFPPKFEFGER